jgi:membrane associated rhomboid family serine protease
MLPIGDDNRGITGPAYVTHLLLWANIGVYILQTIYPEITYGWSVIPLQITTGADLVDPQSIQVNGQQVTIPQAPSPDPVYITILSAMFMHANIAHLAGNLLFLWIFGDNVEHRFGSVPFLVFYLVSGVAGTLVQVGLDPESVIPNLGASGAISGVLVDYMILFPRNRVYAFFLFTIVSVPAIVAIGLWVLFQVAGGLEALGGTQVGGVAYGAHLGGFAAGVLMGLAGRLFLRERRTVLSERRLGR